MTAVQVFERYFGRTQEYLRIETTRAPVAQLDRANGFEPLGWGFKSLRARQLYMA